MRGLFFVHGEGMLTLQGWLGWIWFAEACLECLVCQLRFIEWGLMGHFFWVRFRYFGLGHLVCVGLWSLDG